MKPIVLVPPWYDGDMETRMDNSQWMKWCGTFIRGKYQVIIDEDESQTHILRNYSHFLTINHIVDLAELTPQRLEILELMQ